MTKKDYIILAKCISKAKSMSELVDLLINALKQDNPRFDEGRFYRACQHNDNA